MAVVTLMPAISGARAKYYVGAKQGTMLRPPVRILSVSPVPGDHQALRGILSGPSWDVSVATNCMEARERLTWNRIAAVVCERNLPDGGWKDLFQYADEYSESLVLIVASTEADAYMRQDVRSLGGYDLLPKPFNVPEVRRVLTRATYCRHQKNRTLRVARAGSKQVSLVGAANACRD